MVSHYIILSSSYSEGKRIALDYVRTTTEIEKIKQDRDRILKVCGDDVSISIHLVHADDETWESLCKADSYFEDVEVIERVDDFIDLIMKDRELSAIDIAKYILSTTKCTQIKLQKMVYYCYAEYLCKYGKKLFKENILAYKYGPVVKSVLDQYSKYKYEMIDETYTNDIESKNIKELPARSRIFFAKDGINKAICIDETISKYKTLSASKLVELTHRENTPWSKCHSENIINEIDDSTIKEYHTNETI
ncbi:MAG: DUF4065 domain-containing protein [Clostridia bacterium]|nr:DUF4065 domain-containing protein [Clostridia bacterium]